MIPRPPRSTRTDTLFPYRRSSDLYLTYELPQHEFLGEEVRDKLIYYPTVTREPFRNQGRITTLVETGKLAADIGLPPLNRGSDRVMLCGSPAMLDALTGMLDGQIGRAHV